MQPACRPFLNLFLHALPHSWAKERKNYDKQEWYFYWLETYFLPIRGCLEWRELIEFQKTRENKHRYFPTPNSFKFPGSPTEHPLGVKEGIDVINIDYLDTLDQGIPNRALLALWKWNEIICFQGDTIPSFKCWSLRGEIKGYVSAPSQNSMRSLS